MAFDNTAPSFAAAQKAPEAAGGSILFAEELTANGGQTYAIEDLDTEKRVRDLKHQIALAIGDRASWATVEVIFAGEVMDDLAKPLSHYGVSNGDTIFFIRSVPEALPPYADGAAAPLRPAAPPVSPAPTTTHASPSPLAELPGSTPAPIILRSLFFRDLDGKTLNLENVSIDETMGAVFARLGREKSMDVEWLRFLWSGKLLAHDKTVRDYGIMNESTIHIVARLHGGWEGLL